MAVCKLLRNTFIFLFLTLNSYAVVASDAYLNMLNAEADGLTLDRSGQLNEKKDANVSSMDGITKKNWAWQGELKEGEIPEGLAQDEFATILKQRFLGSFVYYKRLNTANQQVVFETYRNISNPNIEIIRRDILNYY